MTKHTIAISVSAATYEQLSAAARYGDMKVSTLVTNIVLKKFAPHEIGVSLRGKHSRSPRKVMLFPKTSAALARLSDDAITEMARLGHSDTYICSRYRLPFKRVCEGT